MTFIVTAPHPPAQFLRLQHCLIPTPTFNSPCPPVSPPGRSKKKSGAGLPHDLILPPVGRQKLKRLSCGCGAALLKPQP